MGHWKTVKTAGKPGRRNIRDGEVAASVSNPVFVARRVQSRDEQNGHECKGLG
jgi:hypothetical protein